MEPLLPGEGRASEGLDDLALAIVGEDSALEQSLPPHIKRAMGELVRSMNCYYSNLIEGHDTHPIDIERALKQDYSAEPRKRELQLEAAAHIAVQQLIDADAGPAGASVVSAEWLAWVHEEFCTRLPSQLLTVKDLDTGRTCQVEPGRFRDGWVKVGAHTPPPPGDLPKFLDRFAQVYEPAGLGRARAFIAAGAAHHRLLWIHPFFDGNGRVARLFSNAYLRRLGVCRSGLWSVSRGLARRVEEYKKTLAAADDERRNDLDGRGTLSERGLVLFCRFFLDICLDQVRFMASLLQTDRLAERIEADMREETALGRLPKGADMLMRFAIRFGKFERGMAGQFTGYSDSQARVVLRALIERGYLRSDSPKGAVHVGFPAEAAEHWFPALFPAKPT
ncbi:Fic family protein [Gloeobacter morelensis MG652769]|uniref:Fic family protein n=2 Tax=Gloeobacter TaxID=33071 RepID=A0ABY3PTS8_9CYAN|nr:Fic family protein [Gloeobacter morelensis MG652769]